MYLVLNAYLSSYYPHSRQPQLQRLPVSSRKIQIHRPHKSGPFQPGSSSLLTTLPGFSPLRFPVPQLPAPGVFLLHGTHHALRQPLAVHHSTWDGPVPKGKGFLAKPSPAPKRAPLALVGTMVCVLFQRTPRPHSQANQAPIRGKDFCPVRV